MRTRILLTLVLGLAVAFAAPAFAKGPSEGSLSGPGLTTPIPLGGEESGGPTLESFGWFAAVFGQTPDPMLTTAPTTELGDRYTVTWNVPGESTTATIVQYVYPYAAGGPLVFTEPGQPFFSTEHTHGGWYQASDALLDALTERGLPAVPESAATGDSHVVAYLVSTFVAVTLGFLILGSRRVSGRRVVAT